MLRRLTRNQRGQALIEALLALAFVVVIITAVVITVINALNSAAFNKNQNLATQYAQEGLDITRNMKDTRYSDFIALDETQKYCPEPNGTLIINENCKVGEFIREIYIFYRIGEW